MDYFTLGLGIVIILYGVYTLILRIKKPDNFGKLSAMKEKYGNNAGSLIHILAYTIMPIAFGIVVVLAGTKGISITQFIAS